MQKRNLATSLRLALGICAAISGCSSDAGGGGSPISGTAGATGGMTGTAGTVGSATAGSGPIGAAGRTGSAGTGTTPPLGGAGTGTATAGTGSTNPPGTAGIGAGAPMTSAGTGAATAGTGAAAAGTGAATAGSSGMPPSEAKSGCTPAPTGTFMTMTAKGGPGGDYTIYRPATLGENGFKHPPVAWGNGLATTPDQYDAWLKKVASNGFVVIANPGTGSDPMVVRQGLEWLLEQGKSGEFAGKLAENCAGTIGYSMGGGAAVGSGSHPEVRAVVSVHGLQDASEKVSGPLLLTTSDDDGFVTPDGFVMPCYNRSTKVPTMLATYNTGNAASFNGHLTPIGDGKQDADPTIQWLRYWLYGDQAARKWFFGADCTLCTKPWVAMRKNGNFD